MTDTSVSVIIPAFNVEACVARAIESALSQTLPPREVIVVDDASTDGTWRTVSAITAVQPGVRIVRHEQNRGPSGARNTGIDAARGEWIAILDADDRFDRDRLRYLVDHARERALDFVADNLAFYDAAAGVASRLAFEAEVIGESLPLDLETFLRHCQGGNRRVVDLGMLKPMMRRRFLDAHGLRYDEATRHGEDFLLYFHALASGAAFGVFPRAGYVQTERVGSISGRASGMSRTVLDYERMRRDTLSLLTHEAAGDARVRRLLAARLERIAGLADTLHVLQSLKQRKLVSAARTLVARPGTWRPVGVAALRQAKALLRRAWTAMFSRVWPVRIGGRDLRRVSRALWKPKYYASLLNMARVCPRFPAVLMRYLFGTGAYPYRVLVRTPSGVQSATAYSHGDMCTVSEIFCREDYKAGSDLGVVVDIGANIGLSALYFLTRNRQSRCYLYEPLPSNVERLRANLAPFMDRVVLQQIAVAEREGVFRFGVEATGRYGGLQAHQADNFLSRHVDAHYIDVPCVHINSVLAEVLAREGTIDLLKIDTEGAEMATVAAIDSAYRRRIKVIYLEASGYSTTLRLEPDSCLDTMLPAATAS